MKKKQDLYQNMTQKQLKQSVKYSSLFRGIGSIIIGILFLIIGASAVLEDNDTSTFVFCAVVCLVFVYAGIFFLKKPEKMEQKEADMTSSENPNNQNDTIELQERRNKYINYSKKYKNLRYLFLAKAAWPLTQAVVIALFSSLMLSFLIIALENKLISAVYILIVLSVFYLIYRQVVKKNYDMLFRQYKNFGLDKAQAEADFKESLFYTVSTEFVYVSSKFIYDSQSGLLLPVSDVVLVFAGYDRQVSQKIVSKVEVAHYLVVCMANGKIHKLMCPEDLGPVLKDDIVNAGNSVTTGYSYELFNMYLSAPDKFRFDYKPLDNVTQMPVGPDTLNNRDTYQGKIVNETTVNTTYPDKTSSNITFNTAPGFRNLLSNEKIVEEKLTWKQPDQEFLNRYNSFIKRMNKSYKIQGILLFFGDFIFLGLFCILSVLKCPNIILRAILILMVLDILFKIVASRIHFNLLSLPSFKIYTIKNIKLIIEGKSKMEIPEDHDQMEIFLPEKMLDKDLWTCKNILRDRFYDSENLYLADETRVIKIPFCSISSISAAPTKGRIEFNIKTIEKMSQMVFLKPDNLTVPFYTVKISIEDQSYDLCLPEYELEAFCQITHFCSSKPDIPKN